MSTVDYLEVPTTNGLVFNYSAIYNSQESFNNTVFCAFVIVIGVFGSFMNGVVLNILLSKKLRSKPSYLLIINQVVLDFLSCLFLIPCYIVKVHIFYLAGNWGKFVCNVFYMDNSVYALQAASITNLVLIAAERYMKIVHEVFHRRYCKWCLLFAGLAFSWVTVVVIDLVFVWVSEVVDGVCYPYYYWQSRDSYLTYGGFVMVWEFIIPLILFAYLYGRILLFVRQRNQAFSGNYTNQAMATSLQTNAHQSQMNVTATMIIVSSAFVLCWLPNQLFYILSFIDPANGVLEAYYPTVFLIFLNVCMNPLIYASKHEEVKKRIRKWFFKTRVQPEVSTVA